jgi:hypothetical protein
VRTHYEHCFIASGSLTKDGWTPYLAGFSRDMGPVFGEGHGGRW